MTDLSSIRRRVIYHGRVQGVGFRYTVTSLARGRPVVGYVRNLADGTVELVVEASADEFESLQQAVRDAFAGNITDVSVEEYAGGEIYQNFEIRR